MITQSNQQPEVALTDLAKWQKLGPQAMTWLSDGKSYLEALELRVMANDTELSQLRRLADETLRDN